MFRCMSSISKVQMLRAPSTKNLYSSLRTNSGHEDELFRARGRRRMESRKWRSGQCTRRGRRQQGRPMARS